MEQFVRDARIAQIYEGTNGIQAMDLVGRKLAQRGGLNLQEFLGDVASFVQKHASHPGIGPYVGELGAFQALNQRRRLMSLGAAARPAQCPQSGAANVSAAPQSKAANL